VNKVEQALARLRSEILTSPWNAHSGDFAADAMELIEAPASPIRMAMLIAICTLFALAITAAWLCKIDIHAEARGRIQSVGRSKIVQPVDAGKVSAIDVQNGTYVSTGTPLVEFDSTEAVADRREYARQVDELSAEIIRRRTAVEAARRHAVFADQKIAFPRDFEPSLQSREQAVLDADLRQLNSTLISLDAKVSQSVAQREGLLATIGAQRNLIKTLQRRFAMRRALEQTRLESTANVIDAQETLQREITSLADHVGQLAQANASIVSGQRDKEGTLAKFTQDNTQGISTAEAKLDDVRQEFIKASAKAARTIARAPIDGVVQELAVTTLGQVVASGQQLMVIVPAQTPIEIEALVSNVDIGFIHVGQRAVIKVDTFPFTIYGSLSGLVTRVSHDAVDAEDPLEALPTADAATAGIDSQKSATTRTPKTRNLVFPATVKLDQSSIEVVGKRVPLSPGMTVDVEILTGQRRVIDYLLSPLREIGSRAIHER
jgi:hemolysin D